MFNRLTAIYALAHILIGTWLLIDDMVFDKSLIAMLFALAFIAFGSWLMYDGERNWLAHLRFYHQHGTVRMWAFAGADALLVGGLLFGVGFPHVTWIALLLGLAAAIEYGRRQALLTFTLFSVIGLLHLLFVDYSVFTITTLDSVFIALVLFFLALTAGHRTDAQLQEAYLDTLTSLPNRTHLLNVLARNIAGDRLQRKFFGMLILDVKQFQRINENLGHGFGDQLLHAIGQRIHHQAVRQSKQQQQIVTARFDGNRFLLLFSGFISISAIEDECQTLIEQFEQPWQLFEHQIELQVHGGLTFYPGQGQHVQKLIEQALSALEQAKQTRAPLVTFNPKNNSSFTERFVIEAGMRKALEQEEFVVYYQPKVNIQSGAIMGIEALVRWNHPELGLLSPNKFIDIAEQNGLILELGEWVLRTACKQHAVWIEKGLPPIRICVNVSYKQLDEPEYLPNLVHILRECGLKPHHLELEITESLALKNVARIKGLFSKMAELGIKLTIDDFGTGYASYNNLSSLPIHALKIDKSFMRGINRNPDAEAIVASIIQLAKTLKLTVTAEGVETTEQLAFLRKYSCDEVQGFLYMQPEPAHIFEPFLKRGFAHVGRALG